MKRKKKRERIYLPNGCSYTAFTVFPENWKSEKASLKKPWHIMYRYYDPRYKKEFPNGRQKQIKGMNECKTYYERRDATYHLLAYEKELLEVKGFNYITGEMVPFAIEEKKRFISPETYLPDALQIASENIKVVKSTAADIKTMLSSLQLPMLNLEYNYLVISSVRRKHIIRLLAECAQVKKTWSPHMHNKYRSYLMMLFKKCIQEEALEHNPVDENVDKEQTVKKIRTGFTIEERQRLHEKFYTDNYKFWRLMQLFFHSGSRKTELFNRKPEHVDLKKQTVRCLVKKRKQWAEVDRTIKDIAMPLWIELVNECQPGHYLFSTDFGPGARALTPGHLCRYWQEQVKIGMGIDKDFYELKHTNTTEVVDALDEAAAAKLNGHTNNAMVIQIYDTRQEQRKHEQLKLVNNKFA